MRLIVSILISGIICFPITAFSQKEINQVDEDGRPHGIWKKHYEGTQQLRYEGKFEHGKEVGEFKFYCEDCRDKPAVIKIYDPKTELAEVTFLSRNGSIISKGEMKDRDRVGEWITYHENSTVPMIRETFLDGKLKGKRTVYYPNGKITEDSNFVDGVITGENIFYSPNGNVIKRLEYQNGLLQGPVNYYDEHGNLIIEGSYEQNNKHGLWKYYKDGKVVLEESFPKEKQE
ncbi:toxin-antitoxin system YwqK family antitoxin [Aequorivita sp. H23M31]|uniref:Toxin-antitoxin system YwqK family antitoxin n=1 Tax=Aequorivita ciconiae TaxID=2494375 RepID=A0A451FS85_9FLAO|nr:toxin-antitoxin system YwqK family antitoxin [Aequorivita sp. H23M31]QAA80240.1 toxin-antitoxin system YwqK family antitoxin [Aequorivita sp. H23M31]